MTAATPETAEAGCDAPDRSSPTPAEAQMLDAARQAEEEEEEEEEEDELQKAVVQVEPRIANLQIIKKYVAQAKELQWLTQDLARRGTKQESLIREQQEAKEELDKEKDFLGKLEQLSRELRKKKDEVVDSLRKADVQEQDERKALSEKFQRTIGEVTQRMDAEAAEQMEVVRENQHLRSRLSVMAQQIDLRSQQYEHTLRTRDMELKLAVARGDHARELAKADRLKAESHRRQYETDRVEEAKLQEQFDLVKENFDKLQEEIVRSNEVFRGYKDEMDKMSRKIKQFEHDRAALLKKYTAKRVATEDMEAERATQETRLTEGQRQGETFQALIQRLTAEAEQFAEWKKERPEEYESAFAALPPEQQASITAAESAGKKKKK